MFISYLRSLILYFVLIAAVRLMGKRQIGQMEPSEFVVAILIADLASVPMQDIGIPLLYGVIPIVCVLCFELLLSVWSVRSVRMRQLICGKPVILMENGAILQRNLKKTRITADELTEHLRQHQVLDLSTVKYAILETNGQLSVLLDPRYLPATAMDSGIAVDEAQLPITLISDGRLLSENLRLSGRNRQWLDQELKRRKTTLAKTFYFTVTRNGKIFHSPRQEERK